MFGSPVSASVTESTCVCSNTTEFRMTAAACSDTTCTSRRRSSVNASASRAVQRQHADHDLADHATGTPASTQTEWYRLEPRGRLASSRRVAIDHALAGDHHRADDAGAVRQGQTAQVIGGKARGKPAAHDPLGRFAHEQRAGPEVTTFCSFAAMTVIESATPSVVPMALDMS